MPDGFWALRSDNLNFATGAPQLALELKLKVLASDPVAVSSADSVAPGEVLVFLTTDEAAKTVHFLRRRLSSVRSNSHRWSLFRRDL